jgi:1-acyl-sn-glycerol-3-phosphate acyltransferase
MQVSALLPRTPSALARLYALRAADYWNRGLFPPMTATLLAALAKLLSGASVRWIDCQPDTCQRVYFANHTSHLDALVVWAALPHEVRMLTRPVAAKDYWEAGRIRKYLATRVFDALLIDRKEIKVHQSPVDLMIREIGETKSLIVFPEGSRGVDGIGEFKSGLYYLSKKRPDLELVPVHIDNLNRVLPRGEFLPVPLLSCISFGPPMWLESGEPKADFLLRAREAVRRLKEV